MRKTISIFAALLMIAALCSGCGKSDGQDANAAEQSKGHSMDDGQDHSGHNH